jgi:organic radical activating enzyme
MKKIIRIERDKRNFQLSWCINNICTNHCTYCPDVLHRGTNHNYDWNIVRGFIERLFDTHSKIHCSISGGEPTVSPHFKEAVDMFYDNGHTVGITTNGVKPEKYWREIGPKLAYACFSYHPQYKDANYLTKAQAASEGTIIKCRIMMDTNHWDDAVDVYNRAIEMTSRGKYTWSVEPVKVLPDRANRDLKHMGCDYTDEQIQWIVDHAKTYHHSGGKEKPFTAKSTFYYDDGSIESGNTNYLIATKQTDFRGWKCDIGIESMFIDHTGYIKKGNCNQGGKQFHINDHLNHSLPSTAEICTIPVCGCNTDVLTSKVKVPLAGLSNVEHTIQEMRKL